MMAIAVIASCTKEQNTQSVTFTIGGYGIFPTKSMSDAIETTLPQTLELTITNKSTGTSYSVKTGEEVSIPTGSYRVEGSNSPTALHNIYGIMLTLTQVPKVIVSEDVDVVDGKNSYSLTASYASAALVSLASETGSWKGTINNNEIEIPAIEYGDYRWIYITGDLTCRPFTTYLTPSGGGEARTFTISGNPDLLATTPNGILVSPGFWYILHPSDKTSQSGGFSIDFPKWAVGN